MNKKLHSIPIHMLLLAGLIPSIPMVGATDKESNSDAPFVAVTTSEGKFSKGKRAIFLGVLVCTMRSMEVEKGLLPEGIGLRVEFVRKDGPAAGVLSAGDILVKFEDQLLCNAEQLRTLVQAKKKGDSVALTFLRNGEEKTSKVVLDSLQVSRGLAIAPNSVLADIHVPEDGARASFRPLPGIQHFDVDEILRSKGMSFADEADVPEEVREALKLFRDDMENAREQTEVARQIADVWSTYVLQNIGNEKGLRLIDELEKYAKLKNIILTQGNVTLRDDQGKISLQTRNGVRYVTVIDAEGREVFSGKIETEEDRKAVAADVLKRLEVFEALMSQCMQDF